MSHKRRFKGTASPPKHYDRKVLTYGFSRMISMGKLIPKEWKYARVTPLEQTKKHIVVRIERLRMVKNNSSNKKIGEKSEQNTQRTGTASRSKRNSR